MNVRWIELILFGANANECIEIMITDFNHGGRSETLSGRFFGK